MAYFANSSEGDGMKGWTCRMYNDGAQGTPAEQQAAQRERRRVEQHPWVAARKGNGGE